MNTEMYSARNCYEVGFSSTQGKEVFTLPQVYHTELNPVAFAAAHQPIDRNAFNFAPEKIRSRLALTDKRWCRLGTIFTPPHDHLSLDELRQQLDFFNEINRQQGRPNDTDIIIRTSATRVTNNRFVWAEPAFLIQHVGTSRESIIELQGHQSVDFDRVMCSISDRWKLYHSDNYRLQQQAIHGRLVIHPTEGVRLDMGTGISQARSLEIGQKTKVGHVMFFDQDDAYRPNTLTLQYNGNVNNQRDLVQKYPALGLQIKTFLDTVPLVIQRNPYWAEFRYYTSHCYPDERFHVMDFGTTF